MYTEAVKPSSTIYCWGIQGKYMLYFVYEVSGSHFSQSPYSN